MQHGDCKSRPEHSQKKGRMVLFFFIYHKDVIRGCYRSASVGKVILVSSLLSRTIQEYAVIVVHSALYPSYTAQIPPSPAKAVESLRCLWRLPFRDFLHALRNLAGSGG